METVLDKNETAILSRVLASANGPLSPDAARAFLAFELPAADQSELRRLAALASDGTLSADDETDLENYRQVGRLLELMKSKARIALKQPADSSDGPRT